VLVVFVIIVVFVAFGAFKAARVRKRRRERVARVELASAEAAGDDEYFAADDVKAEAKADARAHRHGVDRAATATRSPATSGPTC
jgi:hypothetical protein